MNKIMSVGDFVPEAERRGKILDCFIDIRTNPKLTYLIADEKNKLADGFYLTFEVIRLYVNKNWQVTKVLSLGQDEPIYVLFCGNEEIVLVDTCDGDTKTIEAALDDFSRVIKEWRNPTEDSWEEMKAQSEKSGFDWFE